MNSARRDIAFVIVAAVLATIICVKFDIGEALARWTRPYEILQLDELPVIFLVIAIALIWFSTRRYIEASRQLALRREAEARLTETLAENQRLASKYVDMQEHERKALARDLHDELGQYVNAIKLDAVSMHAAANQPLIQETARSVIANVDRVYDVLRGLIRQLRPVAFDDLGLAAALEHCVNEWRLRLPATQIELLCGAELESLVESNGLVLLRLVQEALTNVARHSSATRVQVRTTRSVSAQGVDVIISDNGRGADLDLPRTGLGLVGMRERVAALGGSIALSSERGAGGFAVQAFIPLADDDGG